MARKDIAKLRQHGKKPPLGEGGRFKMLSLELKEKGAETPEALAAWIGRKKYGKERFQKLSLRGRHGSKS